MNPSSPDERGRAVDGYSSTARAERILRERAVALARPRTVPVDTQGDEQLVIGIGAGRYAIETARLLDVVMLRELTRIPRTASCIAGVILHRGRVVPVLDFELLSGLATSVEGDGSLVVILQVGDMLFGVLAASAEGVSSIALSEATASAVGADNFRTRHVKGVSKEMVAILDMETVAEDFRNAVLAEAGI